MGSGEVLALVCSSSDIWPVWLMAFVTLEAWLALYLIERKKVMACGIAQIDGGDMETFVQFINAMFRQAGFRIERTVVAGLNGMDLVISKDGRQATVLLRKFTKRVGARIVRATLLASEHRDGAKAMLVTNTFYTREAEALAGSKKVLLWNRRNLINALFEMHEKRAPAPVPRSRTRRIRVAAQQETGLAQTIMRTYAMLLRLVTC